MHDSKLPACSQRSNNPIQPIHVEPALHRTLVVALKLRCPNDFLEPLALQLRQSVLNVQSLDRRIGGQLLRFQHRQDRLALLLIQT